MRTYASITTLFVITLAMAGCGGGDGCGDVSAGTNGSSTSSTCTNTGTGPGTGTTKTVTSLTVSSSAATIPADGSAAATITVIAKDSTNAIVSGVTVTFASTTGNITVGQATTDTTGAATATLKAGSAAAGSTITVTATSGSASAQTSVMVANTQTTMTLLTSVPQIPSDNTIPAVITAFVKDASNNFVPGVVVHFQASSGGLTVNTPTGGSAGMTDATGAATATLSVSGDQSNRAITVTATEGASTGNIVVNVVGTAVGVAGPDSLVVGNAGTYTVSLTDAGKKAIPSQTATITSAAGNTLSAATVTTDASGHATFTLTATKAATDTITVSALGTSASQSVVVSNQQFQFTAPTANVLIPITVPVAPATACVPNTPVTVNWKSSGNPIADNTVVNFASTRGTLSSGTATTTGGNATVMICSTSAGPATLSASATGVSATQNVSFVSNTPSTVDLQAGPSTVPITGQSTLTAIVRDARGNLVQGQSVDFTLTDVTGGSLSLATANTDVEGVAQTVYTASNTASASNGVSIAATVHSNTAITKTTTLTVDGSPLHISLGTGNKLIENDTKTAFMMNWFVSVLDAAGHPVPNTPITLTVHSASRPFNAYYKGSYVKCGTAWVQYDGSHPGNCAATPPVQPTAQTACLNEDLNLTGVYSAVEDISRNGKLDPGDVALAAPGVVTTAADGTGTFQVIYPEDHALWVQVTLTANATVQGTESSTSSTFLLPMLAEYVNDLTSTPPGFVSPYGTQTCTDPN